MKNKFNNSDIVETEDNQITQCTAPTDANLSLGFPNNPVCTWINSVCSFSDWENTRSVRVRDQIIFCYDKNDKEAEKVAVVYLFREGWAQQQELSMTFGYGTSTIRTWRQRVDRDGLAGVVRKKRRSPSLVLGGTKDLLVARCFHSGLSNYAIGRRLGVGEHAVRLALKRLGLKRQKKQKDPELLPCGDDQTSGNATEEAAISSSQCSLPTILCEVFG